MEKVLKISCFLIVFGSVCLNSCSKSEPSPTPPPSSDSSEPPPVVYTPPKDSDYIVVNDKKVVEGYLTPSKWYAYSWNDINYSDVTHIVYAFLRPTSATDPTLTYGDDAYEKAAFSQYPDLTDKTFLGYGDKLIAKAHANNVKILIGIAGGSGKNARDLSSIFADENLRKQFINNLVELCEEHGYDGVDLDYEYPKSVSDGKGITNFAQELRVAFEQSSILSKKDMLITMAVPTGKWSGEYYEYEKLAKCCNWFSPMTYGFAAKWTTSFSFISPLYTDKENNINSAISTTLNYLKNERGVNPLQIAIGIPFYGWIFDNYTQLGASKSKTNGTDKSYTSLYNEYIKDSPSNGFEKHWNEVCKQSCLVNTETHQMITYDDEKAIAEKCKYVKTNGLKGVMIWELSRGFISGAKDPNPLLTAIGDNLLR